MLEYKYLNLQDCGSNGGIVKGMDQGESRFWIVIGGRKEMLKIKLKPTKHFQTKLKL